MEELLLEYSRMLLAFRHHELEFKLSIRKDKQRNKQCSSLRELQVPAEKTRIVCLCLPEALPLLLFAR